MLLPSGCRTVNRQHLLTRRGLWCPQSGACALRVWKKGNYFDVPTICDQSHKKTTGSVKAALTLSGKMPA